MTDRRTIVLRVCVNCRTSFGFGVWPWNGERVSRTHGLCRPCFTHLEAIARDESDELTALRPGRA
jgi:hypothetical protein